MADLFAVAGSKFYIGAASIARKSTDFVAGDFSAVTWIEVDGWETCGTIGDTAEEISTQLINTARVVKQKGTNDAGAWENNFATIASDPGQLAMVAAQGQRLNYPFKVEWASGEVWRMIGLVMSKAKSGGGANTVDMRTFNVGVNSNIVET